MMPTNGLLTPRICPLLTGMTANFSAVTAKKPAPLHVMVVDDEPLIRWSVAETLAEGGDTVTEAGDGATAVRALKEGTRVPDVIVLDLRLPDSNNLGLLASIRRLAPQSHVIVITAFGTPEIARGALDLGAYRVVGKPFELHDLAALVREARDARWH